MFRKYYTEANNDIKPDEAFVNSVIKNATRRKPPTYKRYTKHAASLAAAAIIVSAAVISMPLWQRVIDKEDEVVEIPIVTEEPRSAETNEQTILSDNAGEAASEDEASAATPPQSTSDNSYSVSQSNSAYSVGSVPNSAASASPRYGTAPRTAGSVHESTADTSIKREDEVTEANEADSSAPDAGEAVMPPAVNEAPMLSKIQPAETENEAAEMKITARSVTEDSYNSESYNAEPESENYTLYAASGSGGSSASEDNAQADYELSSAEQFGDYTDAPAPSGYYCTNAAWNSYTFENDKGAVIYVFISYGGEDSEPRYSVDGDYIHADYAAYGMRLSIDAYGADLSAVEEIINSLR